MKHDRKCLAQSAIAAVENHRDCEWTSYDEFLTGLDHIREIAQGYLDDEIMTCTCAVNTDREGDTITALSAEESWVQVSGDRQTGIVDSSTQRERWASKLAYSTELVETGWHLTMIPIPGWVTIPDRVQRSMIGADCCVTALDFLTFGHNALPEDGWGNPIGTVGLD